MAASITEHLQIFNFPQLPHFSTDLDETGIKIHGLLISSIQNIVIIRFAVPFNQALYLPAFNTAQFRTHIDFYNCACVCVCVFVKMMTCEVCGIYFR